MFSRKKDKAPAPQAPPKKKTTGAALMAQMGLGGDLNMDNIDDMVYGDLDNDEDLEAELRALQEEDDNPRGRKMAGGKAAKGNGVNVKSVVELDKMIALSLHDMPDDDDVSDTEDPDLLAELEGLGSDSDEPVSQLRSRATGHGSDASSSSSSSAASILTTLYDRSDNYQQAINSAKAGGDAAKVRRLERGLQTLQGLLKQAKGGKPVPEDDIPPAVIVPKPSSNATAPSAGSQPSPAASSGSATAILPSGTAATGPVAPTRQSPLAPTRESPLAPAAPSRQAPLAPSAGPQTPSAQQPPVVKPRASLPPAGTAPQPAARDAGTQPSTINVAKVAVNAPPVPLQTGSAASDHAAEHQVLVARRDQYKAAAVKAKHDGNSQLALSHMKTAKQFDAVIQAMDEGKPVDLSKMPPPPPGERAAVQARPAVNAVPVVRDGRQGADNEEPLPELTQEDKQKLFHAPEKAGSVMEALQQRLAKYREAETAAKEEGSASKEKRMGRIVKQYDDAIKQYKAGKPVNFEELPCPPGFPPIPVQSSAPKPAAASAAAPNDRPAARTAPSPGQGQGQGQAAAATGSLSPKDTATAPKVSPKPGLQKQMSMHSRAEQQTTFIINRQNQFKQAAMSAKTTGDLELAKKYLRLAKGFDQMIDASRCGLPVDLAQVPPPPGTGNEDGFEFVTAADVAEGPTGDRDTEYKRLQEELVQQTKMCENNRDNFTKLGDVSSAAKFDKMYQSTRKDLEALKNAYEHNDPVPRFHYETRQFSLVQSCPDLGDNDLEITVVRGVNYNLPAGYAATDLVTFVKYEFPFPAETPQHGETDVVKGTNSPEYNKSFKLDVTRKPRSLLRVLKSSKCAKFEVWYKRGFLKGDKLLGTISIKLQPLEDKCVYHDSYDLMEGRKSVGGKLEVKLRIRDPYVNKQVEEVKEKWLVIDQFERRIPPPAAVTQPKPAAASRAAGGPGASRSAGDSAQSSSSLASISVLRYEKQSLDQRIAQLHDRLNPTDLKSLQSKGRGLERQAEELSERLRKGGAAEKKAYVDNMLRLVASYNDELKTLAKLGDKEKDKLQMVLMKRKLVEKEIETLRGRSPAT